MTKSEYMSALQDKLESFNRELQQEITEDYEQHFAEGLAAGKTEAEIIEELGNIEDMIRELPEEDIRQETEIPEASVQRKDSYEGNYSAVVIEGLIADVVIEKSDDGRIQVDYRSEEDTYMQQRYRFYQYEENGSLHVGIKDCGAGENEKKIMLFGKTLLSYNVFRNNGNIKLFVRIPDGMPKVEARTGSGDITARGVNAGNVKMNTASGDIKVWDVVSERLALRTASGDVMVTGGESGSTELVTTSGDIKISGIRAQAVRLHSSSGDIEGHDINGRELNVGTGSGDVSLFGSMEEYTVMTGSGDIEIQADKNAERVKAEAGSGDVSLDLTKTTGAEVHASVGCGECVIYDADGARHEVSYGSCTVGSGACKVTVRTGSGDAEIRCR